MLSGYGVFGLGRNHPEIRRVLTEFLGLNYPSLVKMEGDPAQRVARGGIEEADANQLDPSSTHSAPKASKRPLNMPNAPTGLQHILYCQKAFHEVDLRRPFREWR